MVQIADNMKPSLPVVKLFAYHQWLNIQPWSRHCTFLLSGQHNRIFHCNALPVIAMDTYCLQSVVTRTLFWPEECW